MLGRKLAAGALWLTGAKVATRSLDLVAMVVIARLLVPSDFGLFSLAAGVLLICDALTDLSLANAIIQMREPDRRVYDTAFTLGFLRGLLITALVCALAGPVAAYYQDPRLLDLLFVLSIVPLIRSLVSPHMAQLQKELRFKPQFFTEACGTVAAFLASTSFAIATHSYWALAAGMIIGPLASTTGTYFAAPYRPRLSLQAWRKIITFSGWLTLANGVNTLNWQADRFFIGARLGTNVLGQYTVGNTLASLPTNTPVVPIMQALYAGFAKLAAKPQELNAAYLLSQSIVVAIALPIATVVSAFAEPIVLLALGKEWLLAAIVIQVLAPVFAIQMMAGPAQSVAMAKGETRRLFRRDVLMLAVRLPLIVLGLFLGGFAGVVLARVFSGLFVIWQNLLLIRTLTGISVSVQVLKPWRSFASCIFLYAVLWNAPSSWTDFNGEIDTVAISMSMAWVVSGMLMYTALHFILWLPTRDETSPEARIVRGVNLRKIKEAKG